MNSEEMDGILPIAAGIFTLPPYDAAPPRLLGGFCKACNRHYFPQPKYCRTCFRETEGVSLGSEGSLYSFTIIRRPSVFGLPNPYGVGYIDLVESNLRIFFLLDPADIENLSIGSRVHLNVKPLGHDGFGSVRLRPFFSQAG
ncbi:MAG: Zn-ribbon domain-containing OB-fold protein [Thermodesulfobacteriota bacterium]